MGEFCDITTRNELASFLGVPRKVLTHILYIRKVDTYYESFDIPKKNGDIRNINAPVGDLKSIQKKIANALWEYQKSIWDSKIKYPKISHAFEKKKNIITNAKIHRNKRFLMNIDLENFFGSFHFGRIRGFFMNNREYQLPKEVATIIAQLTCYNGCLPQGAPSSPIITNLICQIFDYRLLTVAKKYKLDYTRYADDLTFSTNNKDFLDKRDKFYTELSKEINKAGFNINEKKTNFRYRSSKQLVTGLVVNKKVNVDKRYHKTTKSMAHHLYTQGKFDIDGDAGTIQQLEGRFAFIDQLDRYNNQLDENKHTFRKLNSREKQYQIFLFYKYFFSNEKPIIVTEGKTDIVYLKAALKNLYADYPCLITKSEKGFEFKTAFLRRTKKLDYFFDFKDGADSMKNLYNFFSPKAGHKDHFPDLFNYFRKRCPYNAQNPVIFIFDNEQINKDKPLAHFANYAKLGDQKKEVLKKELSIRLMDDSNLFIVTNPLVSGKEECEIEELFDEATRNHKIDGKSFSLDKKYDTDKFYGKEIFSKYISRNYEKIDFNMFKGILDSINTVINSYGKE